MSSVRRGSVYLGLGIAVVAVSWAAPLIRLTDAPSLAIAFYRLLFSALLLFPFAIRREQETLRSLVRKDWLLLLLSGVFLALHFGTWISSLALTSVASSVAIVATQPVFAGLLALLLMRERIPWLSVLGMILAIAGSGLIGASDMTAGVRPLLGDLLALLGAIFVAGYMLIGRSLRRTLPLLTYVFPVYLAAAVTLGLVCLVTGTPLGPFRPEIWLLLLLLAVVPQVIGHSLLNWSLKHLKTYVVAMAVLGEPIGASLLTLLLFREIPGSMVVIGGGVILGGVFLAIHGERGQKVIR